ncbi:NADPH-dependent FMN reductase [Rickettsiales bacterium LUAb2]
MNLKIIIGSVRKGRIGPQIANWAYDHITKFNKDKLNVELLDIAEWYLPMDDEPHLPMTGNYVQEHTIKWSNKIKEGDMYIFVIPEYNFGYPAALKNAIDHLFLEWQGKPALMISYGGKGGVKSAEQLKQVLEKIKMITFSNGIEVPLNKLTFDDNKKLINTDTNLNEYSELLSIKLLEMINSINK